MLAPGRPAARRAALAGHAFPGGAGDRGTGGLWTRAIQRGDATGIGAQNPPSAKAGCLAAWRWRACLLPRGCVLAWSYSFCNYGL
jgi:hypothetical protein